MCWHWKRRKQEKKKVICPVSDKDCKEFIVIKKVARSFLVKPYLKATIWKSKEHTQKYMYIKYNTCQHGQSPYICKPQHSQKLLLGETCPRKCVIWVWNCTVGLSSGSDGMSPLPCDGGILKLALKEVAQTLQEARHSTIWINSPGS